MDLYAEIERRLRERGTVNVILAGITCSGKTTSARLLQKQLSEKYTVSIVSQDDYFKDLPDIPCSREGYLTDSIDAFRTEEFRCDVRQLLQDGAAVMPVYDVASNRRLSKSKTVRAGQINIFEGLHTISLLRDLDDRLTVFVDTPIDVCLDRRIARDTAAFGVPEGRIRQYWNACILPMSERYIFPQKAYADLILNGNGGDNHDGQRNL